MALPTLVKSYSVRANNALAAQGTVFKTKMMTFKTIKDKLVLDGWTVVRSSSSRFDTASPAPGPPTNPFRDPGTVSNADNWNSVADFTTSSYGIADQALPDATHFPWIVLKNSGLPGGNFQLLISCNNLVASASMLIRGSLSVGFTGGTASVNPTASDQFDIIASTTAHSGVNSQHQIHTWVSSDLEVTRVRVWQGTTNMCISWDIEKPRLPSTNWTVPTVVSIAAITAGIATTYANLANPAVIRSMLGTTQVGLGWTGESSRGGLFLAEETDIGTVVNDLTSEWQLFPIGVAGKTVTQGVSVKGKHGYFTDIWWRPTSVADTDTFPNDANDRKFVACGPCVLPWLPGTATVMAVV